MEIEKKFLVKRMPDNLEQYKSYHIEQGYLCREPVLRIRKKDDRYILTFKSMGEEHEGVRCNDEVERRIPETAYLQLRSKVDGYLIEKTRYMIPLEGYDYKPIELDVFHGRLEGLVFAELEFPDVETALAFTPPEWLGENVSDDSRYSNSYLSTLDSYTP